MRDLNLLTATLLLAFALQSDACAQDAEISELRETIAQLQLVFDTRIDDLERRLAIAEQRALQPPNNTQSVALQPASSASAQAATGAAFNPAIGVIFQGHATSSSDNPTGRFVPGFPFGGETGATAEGLAIGETEINMSANVDDKFAAWLTTPVVVEDGEARIEIEEAWIETTALGAGLSAKFGRFYSGIGYLNARHSHSWDFADQPLTYQAFLGDQYLDDGVQLRWLPPTDRYVELGAEIFDGNRYPASGSPNSGIGSFSLFANFGGDVGTGGSWIGGLSYLSAAAVGRLAGPEDAPLSFSGDTELLVAHFVWKWAPFNNWKQKNLTLQTEFMWRREDGAYTLAGTPAAAYGTDQRGFYVQASYQPFPRWRFGGRFDLLTADDPGAAFAGTILAPSGGDPQRYSVMADWSNSEFSRLRLQFTHADTGVESNEQLMLQYIYSIGAHGAHTF